MEDLKEYKELFEALHKQQIVPKDMEEEALETRKERKKPKKKPVVIVEESDSESEGEGNVVYIKRRSNKKKVELPPAPPPAPEPVKELPQFSYPRNPFYAMPFRML